ncbi:alpha/beta hydrolase [Microbacterium sp. NPDC087665]|uniref:alpha/beta hydrolase n=1 Tax=Microbacterium sp. NPDC087665 TaxID=3364194 RepID=UPI00381ABA34
MSAVNPSSVPHVLDAAVVEGLGEDIVTSATLLETTMVSAVDRWQHLPEVFDVAGAEGAVAMLDPSRGAASEFVTAMIEARRVLTDAAMNTLPVLKRRREELLERIITVNKQHADAISAASEADSAYWTAFRDDPDSDETSATADERTSAADAEDAANTAVTNLKRDIEKLRSDIEAEEEWIAGELGRISGGDVVRGAWGDEVRVSQTYWGEAESVYPGGPTVTSGLAEHLRQSLSDAAASRITWLSTASETEVEEWLAAHPDFASGVGFVDPQRASYLFENLEDQSTRGADGAWTTGPLAALFALAPFAIGNLNGIPAVMKNEFNRETLNDLLAGDLTETQRTQLERLRDLLAKGQENPDPPLSLLSLFLETDDGSPRASVGFGDVDTADQITTVTHGIETDMGNLGEWSDSAISTKSSLDKELADQGIVGSTAMVLFMEWDSGGTGNVWNIERPDSGAERAAQLLRGFQTINPAAQLNLELHSLGTTAGTQMIVDNPGLVDNVWLYGSAGLTEQTAADLKNLINDKLITVHATHASDDFIAPIGRWPVSEHPVDPRTIAGVETFSSDGGFVSGYGSGDGEHGERTEGHNSQASTEWYYLIDGFEVTPTGDAIPVMDDEAVGYLDPRSQSFKQTVMDLAAALDLNGGRVK